MKIVAIILIAGNSRRFKSKTPKQFQMVNGWPLFCHSIKTFANQNNVSEIILVCKRSDLKFVKRTLKKYKNCHSREGGNLDTSLTFRMIGKIKIVLGGKERQDSVLNGLKFCAKNTDIVLIHDGVRPLITNALVERIIKNAKKKDAVVPVVPITETVKKISNFKVLNTVDRKDMYVVQTPQAFQYKLILKVLEKAKRDKLKFTDEAGALEHYKHNVYAIDGDRNNIKVTTKEDLGFVNNLLKSKDIRAGHGFDIHSLIEGRRLIIGGVNIPFEKGLFGHSDADALIHAVIDSILGACGLNDIGTLFPDSDNKYKDISSLSLLKKVTEQIKRNNFNVLNIDSTVYIQKPKLRNYISKMRKHISHAINIDEGCVNIKAKTFEGLGMIGNSEAVAAESVCLVCNG